MKRSMVYILLFFFAGSIVGWIWEAVFYWCTHSGCSAYSILLEYRGVLHGPWAPIYGFGGLLILILGKWLKKHPVNFLFSSMAICGAVEYLTSFILEKAFHARWWDYSDSFLNLNGRICAGSLLFFGFAGMAVAYFVEPRFYGMTKRIPAGIQKLAAFLLLSLFVADVAISAGSPNMGIGVRGIGA